LGFVILLRNAYKAHQEVFRTTATPIGYCESKRLCAPVWLACDYFIMGFSVAEIYERNQNACGAFCEVMGKSYGGIYL
jgi:hypothetical protein